MSPAGLGGHSLSGSSNSKSGSGAPKLNDDGSNWVSYKQRMADYIVSHPRYYIHLKGLAKEPTKPKDGETNKTALDKYAEDLDDYMSRQAGI